MGNACRALEGMNRKLATAGHVPDAHGSIHAGGDERFSVGGKTDRKNKISVPAQAALFLARLAVPEPNGSILAGGGKQSPVGADSQRRDASFVSIQDKAFFRRGGIPQPDGMIPTSRRHGLAGGGEGQGGNASDMARMRLDRLAAGYVPFLNGGVAGRDQRLAV